MRRSTVAARLETFIEFRKSANYEDFSETSCDECDGSAIVRLAIITAVQGQGQTIGAIPAGETSRL